MWILTFNEGLHSTILEVPRKLLGQSKPFSSFRRRMVCLMNSGSVNGCRVDILGPDVAFRVASMFCEGDANEQAPQIPVEYSTESRDRSVIFPLCKHSRYQAWQVFVGIHGPVSVWIRSPRAAIFFKPRIENDCIVVRL